MQMVEDFVDVVKQSVRVCARVREFFVRLAKLMIVCQNSRIVTVTHIKRSQGFKTWNVWTWRP